MKKGVKVLIIVGSIFTFLATSFGLSAYFLLLHHYHGKEIINEFSPSDTFDISKIPVVEKNKDKDFVILNLADVQMCDLEDIKNMPLIHKEISELVENTKPNLITLTGDQTWSNENLISLKTLIGWMESYKIPWAPVFGNHDFGNPGHQPVLDNLKCCELYERAKYCLFDRGPSNLGCVGNYIVNIKEEDKIIKTIYMLDHGILDDFTKTQIDWINWSMENIKISNGGIDPEGMMFFHKPTSQFFNAWLNGEDIYINTNKGFKNEIDYDDELYELAKNHNIKDMVCGHNHWMHFANKDENNITFTMSLKTGELGGYYEDENYYGNGATYFTISQEETKISDYYVSRDKYHIS